MRYELIFPINGVFIMAGPQADFDKEFLEPQIEQYFSDSVLLSGQEIAEHEREIDFFLHDVMDTCQMQDNTGILEHLDKDWLRRKIQTADLSVCVKECNLTGVITVCIEGALSDYENEMLGSYIKEQFKGVWLEKIQEMEIPVTGGHVKLKLEEPLDYFFEVEKKYKITSQSHPKYAWLHRIQALMDVNEMVRSGDLGGYVESESNLSQEGGCWIYDHAICCGEAVVEKEARLFDGALARDSALITGDSCMFDRARAEGHCCIRSGEIKEDARVAGNAVLSESMIDGLSPLIAGYSNVYGEVRGWFVVKDSVLPGEKWNNPTQDLFILEDGKKEVMVKERKLEPLTGNTSKKKEKGMER